MVYAFEYMNATMLNLQISKMQQKMTPEYEFNQFSLNASNEYSLGRLLNILLLFVYVTLAPNMSESHGRIVLNI